MQVTNFTDYREYLKAILEERAGKNSRYSQRAFARDLRISPQMLSFVLNGKKGFSAKGAVEIADRLSLDPDGSGYFQDLVSLAHVRSPAVQALVKYRIELRRKASGNFQSLAMETFETIADWHHYAILELTFVKDFSSRPRWIAKRLGLSLFEAARAIERLKNLSLLKVDSEARLIKNVINISANYDRSSVALRKLARQLLQKAIASLESQSPEERDLTNITMAIDPARLPEAKKMISEFRRKLCSYLEQGTRTEVYVFAPSLFRLSQPQKRSSR